MCHITNQLYRLKKHSSLLIRIALSVGLMIWLATKVDWKMLFQLDAMSWISATAICIFLQLLCGVRWWSLARPLGLTAGLPRMMRLHMEGMFFNLCLPSSIGGDVVKSVRASPTKLGRILAGCSTVADRMTGLCAVLILGFAAHTAREWQLDLWQALLCGTAIFITLCGAVWIGLATSGYIAQRFPEGSKIRNALTQLDPYHSRPALFWRGIAISLVAQSLNVVSVWILGNALGIQLTLANYFSVVPIVALVVTAPISICGVGVRETAMMKLMFMYFSVPETLGSSLGLAWTSINVAASLCGGLVYMFAPKLTHETSPASEGAANIELDETKNPALQMSPATQFQSVA